MKIAFPIFIKYTISDLSETTIHPTTRLLTQVTMSDAEKADKAMQIFMNDTFIKYKRLFYAGRVDFD